MHVGVGFRVWLLRIWGADQLSFGSYRLCLPWECGVHIVGGTAGSDSNSYHYGFRDRGGARDLGMVVEKEGG